MRELVYSKRLGGPNLEFDYVGKKYNQIVVEMFCDSTFDYVDILKRGCMVLDCDGFSGDLWKLYALNCQRDYLLERKNYDLAYHQMLSGYGGVAFGSGYSRKFMLPLVCKIGNSNKFSLRVTNCHMGIYSVPQNKTLTYSVSLYYDDSINFPCLDYLDDIKQGESKNWKFGKRTNAYLLTSFLLDKSDYAPEFNQNMAFSDDRGQLPLSVILPNTQRIEELQYFNQNF